MAKNNLFYTGLAAMTLAVSCAQPQSTLETPAQQGYVLEEFKRETFEDRVLSNEVPAVVEFTAPWCGVCHSMQSELEIVCNEFSGEVLCGTYDITQDKTDGPSFGYGPDSAGEYQGVPMFAFYCQEEAEFRTAYMFFTGLQESPFYQTDITVEEAFRITIREFIETCQ